MFNPGGDFGFGSGLGVKLVCDQYTGPAPTPKPLAEEALGCALIPARMNQNIEYIAI